MTMLAEPITLRPQTIEEQLGEVIAGLPKSPTAIMFFLHSEGIRGDNSCAYCPLALYFSRMLDQEVLVSDTEALIYPAKEASPIRVALPSWVQTFITEHDDRRYPLIFADIEE